MKYKSGKYTIEITHPDFIVFGKSGITKVEMAHYYYDVADVMVPHIKNRALTMRRFPEGIRHEGFFQKNVADYFPSWIKRFAMKKQESGTVKYVVANNQATLVYLAQQYCIEMHPMLSKIDKVNYPDMLVFDIDPSDKKFFKVIDATLDLKKILESFDLVPFVKTTGSRGLHVVVPIRRTLSFDQARCMAREIAQMVVAKDPSTRTIEVRKQKRGTKVFIDVARNALGQTAVAPYSIRAQEGAPVAVPLMWKELKNPDLRSNTYTIKTVFKRLDKFGDLWKDMFKDARSCTLLYKKLCKPGK